MMTTIKEINLFFSHSPKRQQELDYHIAKMEDVGSNRRKLVDLCRTRWVARIEAFEIFDWLFPAVVNTLEEVSQGIRNGWNKDSAVQAEGLLDNITKFEFIIAFVVVKKTLGYVKDLTLSLQQRASDICKAYSEINNVRTSFLQVRRSIDLVHLARYKTAVSIGKAVGASDPAISRRCQKQKNRDNVPGESPEVYFRRSIGVPFLDVLINHLDVRFGATQTKVLEDLRRILPSSVIKFSNDTRLATPLDVSFTTNWIDDMCFLEDLPSPNDLLQEIHNWTNRWMRHESPLPDNPADALHYAHTTLYPNINRLLRIFCTLPVTTSECERTVSVLIRLKTYLRSTMRQDRLSSLALLHIDYSMVIDVDEVIDMFALKHPKRMILRNIIA